MLVLHRHDRIHNFTLSFIISISIICVHLPCLIDQNDFDLFQQQYDNLDICFQNFKI